MGCNCFERDWQEQSGQVDGKIKSGLPENFYNEGWLAEEIDNGPTGFLEYQTGLLSRMGEKVGGSNRMKGVVLLVCGSSWSLHLIHAFA